MIWFAKENDTTWLPNFDIRWLPPRLNPGITIVRSHSEIGLQVGGVIGAIPLNNGDTLRITPKVGTINFLRMLMTCEGLFQDFSTEFENLASYNMDDEYASYKLITKSFGLSLMEVKNRSLRFDRKKVRQAGQFARGRVQPESTEINLKQAKDNPIVFDTWEREYDTAENRVLGKAASVIIGQLRQISDSDLIKAAEFWSNRFSRGFSIEDLFEVNRRLLRHQFGGSRGYYVKALGLAKIILGEAGISSDTGSSIEADGLLINSANLFEQYLRKLLIDSYKGQGVLVTKGGGISNRSLYLDGSFELEPDFVFQRDSKFLHIADAKYKRPDSKDHYQMVCYLSRYGVRSGVLFHPELDPANDIEPRKRSTSDGLMVWEVPLPLQDLDSTQSILGQALERFAG